MNNPTPEDKMREAKFPIKEGPIVVVGIRDESDYAVPLDRALEILAEAAAPLEGSWPWALEQMKAGKRVQRCKWNGLYIRIADGKVWRPSGDTERPATVLHTAGLLADDWRIVPEEE